MFEVLELEKAVVLLAGLYISAWIDLKREIIYVPLIVCMGIIGVICHIFLQENTIWNLMSGMLIGVILLLGGIWSGEKIGYGDGVIFIMTGIFLGFWGNMLLLVIASILAGVTCTGLLLAHKKCKEEQIVFVPFIFISYVILLILTVW